VRNKARPTENKWTLLSNYCKQSVYCESDILESVNSLISIYI